MAFLGIGALIGGGILGGVVDFAITMAASVGLSYAAQALAGKPKPAEAAHFSTQIQLQAGGITPRAFLMGKTATGGLLTYFNTWGNEGETPNAYYTQVIRLSDLPIKGLLGVWVNGERVTLGADTGTGMGLPVAEYNKDGKDHLWLKFYDGTQTAADSFLTSKVSSAARPYESTRVGTGIAYVICTALVDDTLYSTGVPTYKFETDSIPLYDPTQDSTNGGTGSQRYSDPTTWGGDGDYLPAVQAYNILRGIKYNDKWVYGLQKTVQANLPTVNWNAQITKCRALIAGADGDEATYRSGGQFSVNAPPADALDALMTACQGKICEVGGFYKVHLGAPDSYSFEFTDSDILSSEEQSYSPFLTLADSINGITGTYPDPLQGWNNADAPAIYNSDYEAQDGNRRLLASPTFDLVPHAAQVQRLMKSALAAARRERKHNVVLPPPFWFVEPGDVGRWNSGRNGYVDKDFEVIAIADKANIDVGVSLQEVDPSDYDWDHDTDYIPGTSGPTSFPRPEPQGILDWAAEGVAIIDADGIERRPAVRLTWDGDVPGVIGVQFEVRITSDDTVVTRGRTDQLAAAAIIITQGLLPDTDYEVRGQYIPSAPRDMLWSDWIPVTTPDTRLGLVDFNAAVTAQVTKILDDSFAEDRRRISELATAVQEVLGRTNIDKREVRSQQVSLYNNNKASIETVAITAADVESALASLTTTVAAEIGTSPVGALRASVVDNSTAIATLDGYAAAQWSVLTDVNGYVAGLVLFNGGSPTSSFTAIVDKFNIAFPGVTGGTPVPVFAVANVGGSAKVALRGDMLVDGQILARMVGAGEITAVKIAATSIDSTKIAINGVDILNIIAGAASNIDAFTTTAMTNITSETSLGSKSVNIQAGTAIVWYQLPAPGGNGANTLRLYVDGSAKALNSFSAPDPLTQNWNTVMFAMEYVTGLSAGNHTFELRGVGKGLPSGFVAIFNPRR